MRRSPRPTLLPALALVQETQETLRKELPSAAAGYWKSSSTASMLVRIRSAFSISLQVTPG